MRQSKRHLILADLLSGVEPSVRELQKKYKLVNPRVQVMRLRKEGHTIYTKEVTEKNTKKRRYYYDLPPMLVTAQGYQDLGADPYLDYRY